MTTKEQNVTTLGAKVYQKTEQEKLELKKAKAEYKKTHKKKTHES